MLDREAYTLRIAQSTPAQLVVITFELTTEFLKGALDEKISEDEFYSLIEKAKKGIMNLITALDFSLEPAQNYYDIYLFIYELLVKANMTRKREPAAEALELLTPLLDGWREAAKQETREPDDSAPQVYAGLTYKRGGGLSEYVVEDESKDYKA